MIKSDNGHIVIEGRNIDLIVEWVTLYREMIEHHPEKVAETCIAFEHELLNANINPSAAAITKSIVQSVKGAHDND